MEDTPAPKPKRFDVVAKGPTVLSSHDNAREASEACKKAAMDYTTPVEVWDHEQQKTIFRARGGEWRWITR